MVENESFMLGFSVLDDEVSRIRHKKTAALRGYGRNRSLAEAPKEAAVPVRREL